MHCGLCTWSTALAFDLTFTHVAECAGCRPTNWPVYRLDQGPKLCNCSPTRGLHPGGGHLYFRLDIIRVKGLSKHTLNTYFAGMIINPKYAFLHAFFFNLSVMSFPKFVIRPKTYPFFPILHVFAPLNDVRAYIAWSWKTTLITWIFFTRMVSNFKYKWPPWGPSRHDGFQIIGDISTLSVLSQVKHMLNQSYIYSRLKIPLYIPGSIKTHRIYTRDFIYPSYYYEALWHDSSLFKRFNSNNEYVLYLTRFTHDIMFGCYKQKQRYVFWYEKWQKNIFQWGNPGERLSECVKGVEIYKIN